jgi:hypothetical protein
MDISGYKEQHGCHNCLNVKIDSDYDSPDDYFCNHDCSLNKKIWNKGSYEKSRKDYAILHEWMCSHRVAEWGVCDFWTERICD